MATHYEILPDEQRHLLPALAPLRDLGFVLYGGTAIALQLGHRASVDFDFFTDRVMDRSAMGARVPCLADAQTLSERGDSWTVLASLPGNARRPVKLSFFSGLGFGRVGEPQDDDGHHVLMASLDDLLGHKLKVLLQRVEAKDYRDIAAMLSAGQLLDRGLAAAMSLFSNFPPGEALKALVHFEEGDLKDLSEGERNLLLLRVNGVAVPSALPILSKILGRS